MLYKVTVKLNSEQQLTESLVEDCLRPTITTLGTIESVDVCTTTYTESDLILKVSKFLSNIKSLRMTSNKGLFILWEFTGDKLIPLLTNVSIYDVATLLAKDYSLMIKEEGTVYGN